MYDRQLLAWVRVSALLTEDSVVGKSCFSLQIDNTATVYKPLQTNHSRIPGERLTHKPVKVRPLEEVWAEEGIEALAGKGWQDLEAEQIAKERLEIRARVRAVLTQPFVSLQPPERAALLLVNGAL